MRRALCRKFAKHLNTPGAETSQSAGPVGLASRYAALFEAQAANANQKASARLFSHSRLSQSGAAESAASQAPPYAIYGAVGAAGLGVITYFLARQPEDSAMTPVVLKTETPPLPKNHDEIGEFDVMDHTGMHFTHEDLLGNFAVLYFGHIDDEGRKKRLLQMAEAVMESDRKSNMHYLTPVFLSLNPKEDDVIKMNAMVEDYATALNRKSILHVRLKGLTGEDNLKVHQRAQAYTKTVKGKEGVENNPVSATAEDTGDLYFVNPEGEFLASYGPDASPKAIAAEWSETMKADKEHRLDSIWDFDPPGELGESGAWKVLKELAATMSMGKDSHEELKNLEPIPVHELIVRLTLLYKHVQEHPAADCLPKKDIEDSVSPETVDTLCQYLYFADQAYDCGTEANLKDVLAEKGYELNFVKLEATWAEHSPAYFVATHPQEKELLITVRGTAQIEDVVTDLTALPTEFGKTKHLVHGGIHASAEFLSDRLLSLSKAMHDAGFRVTVVGHSLGAGAAALLAITMRNCGMDRVKCYAFATPNCVDLALSSACADYVTSVVFRDDIVTRVSPEALAGLHRQLLDFDLDAALEKAQNSDDMLLRFVAFLGSKTADNDNEEDLEVAESASPDKASNKNENKSEEQAKEHEVQKKQSISYRPHIPGSILYIYRSKSSGQGEELHHELAFVKGTCKALRCIRLSDKVVTDHLIDSYFMGFGRKNPSKERAERLKQERKRAKKEGGEDAERSEEEVSKETENPPEQSADDRDKEAKDKWRSWKAKLGLVG